MFLWPLHAKPCRIIWKLPQKLNFGPETCEIGPKDGTWKETLQENILFSNAVSRNKYVFCLQTTLFDGFNVLMSFLAQK